MQTFSNWQDREDISDVITVIGGGMTRSEKLASDIDALLHGGQRAPKRFLKLVPLIEDAFADVASEQWEDR